MDFEYEIIVKLLYYFKGNRKETINQANKFAKTGWGWLNPQSKFIKSDFSDQIFKC